MPVAVTLCLPISKNRSSRGSPNLICFSPRRVSRGCRSIILRFNVLFLSDLGSFHSLLLVPLLPHPFHVYAVSDTAASEPLGLRPRNHHYHHHHVVPTSTTTTTKKKLPTTKTKKKSQRKMTPKKQMSPPPPPPPQATNTERDRVLPLTAYSLNMGVDAPRSSKPNFSRFFRFFFLSSSLTYRHTLSCFLFVSFFFFLFFSFSFVT